MRWVLDKNKSQYGFTILGTYESDSDGKPKDDLKDCYGREKLVSSPIGTPFVDAYGRSGQTVTIPTVPQALVSGQAGDEHIHGWTYVENPLHTLGFYTVVQNYEFCDRKLNTTDVWETIPDGGGPWNIKYEAKQNPAPLTTWYVLVTKDGPGSGPFSNGGGEPAP